MKRRDFLKTIGVISGGLTVSCTNSGSPTKLIPYLVPPEDGIIPGEPIYYASTCTECPAMCGLQIKTREGSPVKLEGNPDHPVNKGALCIRGQASLAGLYHPERLKKPMIKNEKGELVETDWNSALNTIKEKLAASTGKKALLTGKTTGTLKKLKQELAVKTGIEYIPELEFFNYASLKKAYNELLGINDLPFYDVAVSDTLITIGADILDTFLNPVAFSNQIKEARKNGLHWIHIESGNSLTGISADERLFCNPGTEWVLVSYLFQHLNSAAVPSSWKSGLPSVTVEKVSELTGLSKEHIETIAGSLAHGKNPSLISGGSAVTGEYGYKTALITAMIQIGLGMEKGRMDFSRKLGFDSVGSASDFNNFVEYARKGIYDIVFFSRINGDYFNRYVRTVVDNIKFKVCFTDVPDAMSSACDLLLPLSHPFESWGDALGHAGVLSLIQPAIKPQYDTKTEGDILISLMGNTQSYRDYLYESWGPKGDAWINKGYADNPVNDRAFNVNSKADLTTLATLPEKPSKDSINLILQPSIRMFDGRSARIKLLHEIPDPLTAVSYGNFVTISEDIGKNMSLNNGDEVKLTSNSGELTLPVRVGAGLYAQSAVLSIDMLHELILPVNTESGDFETVIKNIKLSKTGRNLPLPVLSGSTDYKEAALRGVLKDSDHAPHHEHEGKETLYPEHKHEEYMFGMAIDLDKCTGCSSCVAACYIENNVPIVGIKEHLKGREMSWIRVEPYYDGTLKADFLPMMCQHCEHAPCEPVCPVYATYHNPDGLNAQVYNRCVGTRYCSNNCPYKVRRFNWYDHKPEAPLGKMTNPDVFRRTKGIMEKCSFCIQRIRYAKDKAKDDGRLAADGEITPACAQTCPSGAIVFGNLKDKSSKLVKLLEDRKEDVYNALGSVGTRPTVFYLKKNKGGHHEA